MENQNVALPEPVRKQMDAAKAAQAAYVAEGEIVDIKDDSPPETQPPTQEQLTPPLQGQQEIVADSGEDWKHKYDVLKGKFDRIASDHEDLLETLQRANATNDNLNNLIVSIQNNAREPVAANEDPAIENGGNGQVGTLDAEDFEGYGDEMVSMVKLVNQLVERNRHLEGKLGNVEGNVENVRGRVEQTVQSGFYNDLDKLIPNWRDINTDKTFLAWLNLPDDISGQIRHEILQGHFSRSDSEMVAKVFRTGATANGIPLQAVQVQNKPSQPFTQQNPSSLLSGQIIPDSAGNENPTDLIAPAQQMITREQYAKASQDVTTGRMSMDQFAGITKQFQKLIAEGKVT